MKLVMLLVVRDDADVVDAQIAFHLNAGVDFVIVTDHESVDGTSDLLEAYSRAGYVRLLREHGEARDDVWRMNMARLAVREHAADWIIDSRADEFWLPRAESIREVLAAIPSRYGAVQALTRVFLPRPDGPAPFFERLTARSVLTDLRVNESAGTLEWALRPIQRANDGVVIAGTRDVVLDERVPLRAWYPIEVLRFPFRSREQAERRVRGRSSSPTAHSRVEQQMFSATDEWVSRWNEIVLHDDALQRGIQDGTFVVDERLRDALRGIVTRERSGHAFALPEDGSASLGLRVPTVVEDVAYAAECEAVREVDFESVLQRVQVLEDRIVSLESTVSRRAKRRLSRLFRR
jgi:glycosyl transferase family 2